MKLNIDGKTLTIMQQILYYPDAVKFSHYDTDTQFNQILKDYLKIAVKGAATHVFKDDKGKFYRYHEVKVFHADS